MSAPQTAPRVPPFAVGTRCNVEWTTPGDHEGEWYDGEVIWIDVVNETARVRLDDGDEVTACPWHGVYVL